MRVLKADSALYERYAETLSTQEDQVAVAHAKIEEPTRGIERAQKRIQDFIGSLTYVE